MKSGVSRLARIARRRAGWFVRDRFPRRRVVREVQGVRMVLPWSHRLPDYAEAGPAYGQNLVELARLLGGQEDGPLTVIDIGANVGDSALQILHATDARVLCVEGDPAYLEFLHLNADREPRISVVEALLSPVEVEGAMTAVRSGGTTRFARGDGADALPWTTPARLRDRSPGFAQLRLVKSDTDGYDVSLVPAVAEAWCESRPVLFFEYDPYLVRLAGLDPLAVWPILESLGYREIAVWDNGGTPVGRTTTADIGARAAVLDSEGRPEARSYWDVAVVHEGDERGRAALASLLPAAHRL